MTAAAHSAMGAASATGGLAFLFVFNHFQNHQNNQSYQCKGNKDCSDVIAKPCSHSLASVLSFF
jgi:hypothetical protein